MDFSLTEDRRMIAETLTRWLRDNYDMPTRNAAIETDTGFSRPGWRALAELGMVAALIPEDAGGLGGKGHDICVVFEALGQELCVEPWLSTAVMSARVLMALGENGEMLENAISGATVLALAHAEPTSRYDRTLVETAAQQSGEGWTLSGQKSVVLHGAQADHLLVTARDAANGALRVFAVAPDADGLSIRGYPTIDGFQAAEITLANTPATALGPVGDAQHAVDAAWDAGLLAVSAEALGAMCRAQEITLEYIKERKQFGKPIGSFQVLQHRMVEMVTSIEKTRSLMINAASDFDGTATTRASTLAALKYYVGVAGRHVAEECTQMHGGIGLANETPISHYTKRIIMIDHLFGDTDHHLQAFIDASIAPK